jgi:hypothetical integral membrane protein (TIGR02206 family)
MSTFFGYKHNPLNQFEPFSLTHIIPLLLIVIGVALIYIFRDQLGKPKYEKKIRYSIAIFAIFLEVTFQGWQIYYDVWDLTDSLPLHLCRLTSYLGIIAMLTKSRKIFEIAYFWSLGGVVSIMFPDILHGPDRYRYYHFMMYHILFFYMYMYMLFVLKFELSFKSFLKSCLTLFLLVVIVIIPVNTIFNMNYMYLLYPADTPFSIFKGLSYIWYLVGCISFTGVILIVWYLPIHFYNIKINKTG